MFESTHSMTRIPEYRAWANIIQRCNNPNQTNFEDYGGRGITVCDRWRNSFENFINDMGFRPTPQHIIGRFDTDGNYEPGNCYWATKSEQAHIQRIPNNNSSGVKGVVFDRHRQMWRAQIGANGQVINLGRFATKEEAIKARKQGELKYWSLSD